MQTAADQRQTSRGLTPAFWVKISKPLACMVNDMVKITFLESDGSQRTGEARNGMSVMEVAVQNQVCGIDADCGGACACATCHVYVAQEWMSTVGVRNELEDDLLDFAIDVRENSRLSCQIRVTDALDGLVVAIPDKQF